jgi:hypothetical protein
MGIVDPCEFFRISVMDRRKIRTFPREQSNKPHVPRKVQGTGWKGLLVVELKLQQSSVATSQGYAPKVEKCKLDRAFYCGTELPHGKMYCNEQLPPCPEVSCTRQNSKGSQTSSFSVLQDQIVPPERLR